MRYDMCHCQNQSNTTIQSFPAYLQTVDLLAGRCALYTATEYLVLASPLSLGQSGLLHAQTATLGCQ